MKAFQKVCLLGVISVLVGCSTINSSPYRASPTNVVAVKQALGSSDTTLSLGSFSLAPGVEESLTCRLLGPIDVAAGKSVSQYVKEALQEELFLAGAYDPQSSIALSGQIERLGFSSVSPASWDISLRISSNKSAGYVTDVNYGFGTSFDAYSACQNVANAFGPAVQELLRRVVQNPAFSELAGLGS